MPQNWHVSEKGNEGKKNEKTREIFFLSLSAYTVYIFNYLYE